MIVCVTPNVALDRTLVVPDFTPGSVQRVQDVSVQAGGKGLNVARAVKTLGGDPLATGLLGGATGRQVEQLVTREGIPAAWTWFDGETRVATMIVPKSGGVTVLNERGRILPHDWERLASDVLANLDGVSAVCISGSLPDGAPDAAPGDLIHAIRAAGVPVWLDASGAALRTGVAARPTGLKVNGAEAGELLGTTMDNPTDAARAARELRVRGIGTVVITLGARGAVLSDAGGEIFVGAPAITLVSDVGSGDSFLAALVLALTRGADGATALCCGVAAGAANALQVGAARFDIASYQALLGKLMEQPVGRL